MVVEIVGSSSNSGGKLDVVPLYTIPFLPRQTSSTLSSINDAYNKIYNSLEIYRIISKQFHMPKMSRGVHSFLLIITSENSGNARRF